MSTNVDAAASDRGGDTITLNLSGGRTMEMSESFARRLDGHMDDVSGAVDSTGRYGRTDTLYDEVADVIDTVNRSGVEYHRGNRDRLDGSADQYLIGLSSQLTSEQRNALVSGETEVGDADKIKDFFDDFRDAFDTAMADKYPSRDSASASSGAADGDIETSDVKDLLAEVKASDNSSEKGAKLSDAIQALISQIKGGGSEASQSDLATDLKSDIEDLKGAIGEIASSPASSEGNNAAGAPEEVAQTEQKTFAGDDLMSRLEGKLSDLPFFGDDLNGKLKFDDSDGGIGIGDDEIGRGETMTFRPEIPAAGGSVDLVDLFGDESGGQEAATISVMKDGQEVDTIEVRGDIDGNQTVQIDQAFDELVFTPAEGKNSDFAIKSITTDTEVDAAPSETGEAPADPTEGTDSSEGAGDAASAAEFDATQLLELLDALSNAASLIDKAGGLSESEQSELFDNIADTLADVVGALDANGEGGSDITADEMVNILESVNGLTGAIEGNVGDSPDKNDVLDALAVGVGKVADEMADA